MSWSDYFLPDKSQTAAEQEANYARQQRGRWALIVTLGLFSLSAFSQTVTLAWRNTADCPQDVVDFPREKG